MSAENVATVRRFWEARNEGDRERVRAEIDPEVVWDLSRSRSPYMGVYRGFEDYQRLIQEVADGWEDFRWEADEIIDAGDRVVVVSHPTGRGMTSGIEVTGSGANVFSFRNGKIVEFVLYQSKEEALEAVGLSGQAS
jgi:ketosteroid isomerase-like protein